MYRKILVALAGSDHDRALLAAAARLATWSGAQVIAMHVGTPGHATAATRVARQARDELAAAGVHAELCASTADRRHLAAAIADEAGAAGVDLVVMGSRGLGEFHAALVGSVSRGVLTRTDRPVLLVRRDRSSGIGSGAGVVLVAFASPDDLEPIISALHGLGGIKEVVAIHVLALAGAPAHAERAVEGERTVGEGVARLRQAGYRAVGRLAHDVTGSVARAIDKEARLVGADLVVVGSARPAGAEGLLLGSTARAVVRLSDRPVLIAARSPAFEAVR